MYYNTNQESGADLKASNKKTKTQEEKVLIIFKGMPKLTASEAWKIYNVDGRTPLTSIRRAITDLCRLEKLVKTEETKEGIYGKKEHLYKWKQ